MFLRISCERRWVGSILIRSTVACFGTRFRTDIPVINFFTTSVGISLYPRDGEDVESLIKNADIAMYKAKEKGKKEILNELSFFTEVSRTFNEVLISTMYSINTVVKCEQLVKFKVGLGVMIFLSRVLYIKG